MKYFLHDTNSFQDEKLTELFMNYGYEGIGLFFTLLEKIAAQEKPIKTTVLKQQLFVGKKLEKCWKFMETIGLISSKNGETFNENLLKFSEKYKIQKEKTRERVSEWRKNQQCNALQNDYEPVSNAPKVKVSKGKINNTPFGSDEPKKEHGFISLFNELTGRQFRGISDKTKRQLAKLEKAGYSNADLKAAILNCNINSKKWENPAAFTPEYITREDKFLLYLNSEPGETPVLKYPAGAIQSGPLAGMVM